MSDYDFSQLEREAGAFDLAAVQAKNLPRLVWSDLFKVTSPDAAMSEGEAAALNEYFGKFAKVPDHKCPGCERLLVGDVFQQALGLATFTWGITNGEGHCSRCGYPARAYHRNLAGGLIEFVNMVLPYHPDELKLRAERKETADGSKAH